jgi:hypothetical protein
MKGMTNRELINALIEHYAQSGEVEVELHFRPDKKGPINYYVIAYQTEECSLQLKGTVK